MRHYTRRFLALVSLVVWSAHSEIILQDFFSGPADGLTNHAPWIDLRGDGWVSTSGATAARLDGKGHLVSSGVNGTLAGFALIPMGPHGFMTATATIHLPTNPSESISMGFNQALQAFDTASVAGPWLRLQGDGNLTLFTLFEGSAQPRNAQAFASGSELTQLVFTFDAFNRTATVSLGGTNTLFDAVPLSANFQSGSSKFFVIQFNGSNNTETGAYLDDLAVDWFPRPRPMLALPQPIASVLEVGPPTGTNDAALIQKAFSALSKTPGPVEVRFEAGATYIIDSPALNSAIPLSISGATNVLVNGNGCQILVKNPRIGFMHVTSCTNVIVRGFVVDYDPLPFTQGIVSRNFFANPNGSPKTAALEVQIDEGYPAPTDPNYTDASAVQNAGRWVLVMDPTRPGRLADNTQAQYDYRNVTLARPGFYHLQMASGPPLLTIPEGSRVCILSRWDSSPLFGTAFSSQVTYTEITNHAGTAANFIGRYADMVNLIGCKVIMGAPPNGATNPPVKTTNADGGLFGYPRIGPWVEDCEYVGLSDDVANANAIPFEIESGGPDATATIQMGLLGGAPIIENDARAGDDCTFLDPITGIVLDRAFVTAVNGQMVTFDHPVAGLVAGKSRDGTLVFNNTLNSSAVYLRNKVTNSRIHGIYCRANNSLIAHNQIIGMGKNGICAHPALDLAGPNSFLPTNVLIVGNFLADCGYIYDAINNSLTTDDIAYAPLQLHKKSNTSDLITTGQEISEIRIVNNTFLDWRRVAIGLRNVTGIDVIGNYFGAPLTNNGFAALTNHVLLDFWAADYPNIRLKDNVSALSIMETQGVRRDGAITAAPEAFTNLAAPTLTAEKSGDNVVAAWLSAVPAFTLQQRQTLSVGDAWIDISALPNSSGPSYTLVLPTTATNSTFLRLRQSP